MEKINKKFYLTLVLVAFTRQLPADESIHVEFTRLENVQEIDDETFLADYGLDRQYKKSLASYIRGLAYEQDVIYVGRLIVDRLTPKGSYHSMTLYRRKSLQEVDILEVHDENLHHVWKVELPVTGALMSGVYSFRVADLNGDESKDIEIIERIDNGGMRATESEIFTHWYFYQDGSFQETLSLKTGETMGTPGADSLGFSSKTIITDEGDLVIETTRWNADEDEEIEAAVTKIDYKKYRWSDNQEAFLKEPIDITEEEGKAIFAKTTSTQADMTPPSQPVGSDPSSEDVKSNKSSTPHPIVEKTAKPLSIMHRIRREAPKQIKINIHDKKEGNETNPIFYLLGSIFLVCVVAASIRRNPNLFVVSLVIVIMGGALAFRKNSSTDVLLEPKEKREEKPVAIRQLEAKGFKYEKKGPNLYELVEDSSKVFTKGQRIANAIKMLKSAPKLKAKYVREQNWISLKQFKNMTRDICEVLSQYPEEAELRWQLRNKMIEGIDFENLEPKSAIEGVTGNLK